MTEEQARTAAQRRNQEAGQSGWREGDRVWVWVEHGAGDWDVEQCVVPVEDPQLWERLAPLALARIVDELMTEHR